MKTKKILILLSLAISLSISNFSCVWAADIPQIKGKAAVTIDIKTHEIIYDKNIDETHMYPASTTKLMTSLILAENKKKTDIITYTKSGKLQPEYSLNLNLHKMAVGETMSAEDAMDSLLLYSANDMAYVVADNVGGNVQNFCKMMNERALKMGLRNTHFSTPNGVDNNIFDHYTTPYELAKIGIEAFNNDWVRETMAKKSSNISISDGTVLALENRNKLLGTDDCIGGKTGYTNKAGRCLVAFFDKGGRQIMGVVMKSVYDSKDNTVFNDMEKIIDWSYNAQKVNIYKSGDTLKTIPITYKAYRFFGKEKTAQVPVTVKENVSIYDNDVNKKELKKDYNLSSVNFWNLDKNKSIGTLTVKERDCTKSYSVYPKVSAKEIAKNVLPILIAAAAVLIIVIILIVSGIKRSIRRKRRRKRYYY